MEEDRTLVYTDGACRGNPGPGGWAWVIPDGAFASGAEPDTTNQRMELAAALSAVTTLSGPLEIVSDSTYVVNCFRDRWWVGWRKRGWVNSQKKPVANRDLWEPLVDAVEDGDVTFRWVKGHAGDVWNDLADRLAVEASHSQEARVGTETPTEFAELDGGSAHPGATAYLERPAEGHLVAIFGHRPPQLGGYDPNPIAERLRATIAEILEAKMLLEPQLVAVTGLRLGAEQLGAEAAVAAGVPYAAVLPYPEPESVWPAAAQRRFTDLRDGAVNVVTLEKKQPKSPKQAGDSLRRRDVWIARNVDEAILVWDEEDASLGRLAQSLGTHLGDDVWVVHPTS